jgi:glutaredoxin
MENSNDLKAMFADYQKSQSQNKKKTAEEILAKYFVPRKPKEIFRILPYKGKNFYDEAYFHVVTTNAVGNTKKFNTIVYCPAHNDPPVPKVDKNGDFVKDLNGKQVMVPAPCPLCAQAKKYADKQDASIKYIKKDNMTPAQLKIKESNDLIYKEATSWEAKKFYIVRGIDKGQEKDGVKFWRFKFNYKRQGVFDKLMPPLEDFYDQNKVNFADPIVGTDISITMGDSEFKGKTYKAVSAITTKGKSALHQDPIVAQQWLDDTITWRQVFKPKNAPAITALQFLELIVEGNSPYWEDSDPSSKHWVFPNHPDLEALANTRKVNADAEDENFEYASDLEDNAVNITNVTKNDVGTYTDNSLDVTAALIQQHEAEKPLEVVPSITSSNEPIVTETAQETESNEPDVDPDSDEEFKDLPF